MLAGELCGGNAFCVKRHRAFVSDRAMQFTKRETPIAVKHAVAAAAIGLLLGFLGPFGSNPRFDRPVRYGFWLGLTLFGYACVLAATALLRHSTAQRWPALGQTAAAAFLSSIPQTFAVAWALVLVQPGRVIRPEDLPALFAAVFAVQFGIALAAQAIAHSNRPSPVPAEPPQEPSFMRKVPAALGRTLIALEAEDHYLRVHTEAGSALVLMRLSDAIAELGGLDGLQVHRGWWVATGGVTGVQSNAGKLSLLLRNGLVVPVSRSYTQAVRSRGWRPA